MFATASRQRFSSLVRRTRVFTQVALLLLLLLPLGVTHALSASAGPGTTTPIPDASYTEDRDDLSVKVMGGNIVIRRAYFDKQWHVNRAWAPLKLTFDSIDGSVKEISRGSDVYRKTADGVYTHGKRLYIRQTPTGFRWGNRTGDWIDYDPQGNITAYGDRNDVTVSFEYQTTNSVSRLTGLFDHFGTKVLTFTYTGNQLTAITDYTNRKVQYGYDLNGNLTQVIDVLGNIWTYAYTVNLFTDAHCQTQYEYDSGSGQIIKIFDQCTPFTVIDGFKLTSRTDPEGRTITLAFAANGFNAGQTYADGSKLKYTYDYDKAKKQHYVKETSPGGKITERWYDADGNRIREVVNGRTVSTLTVEPRRRIETNERNLATIYDLDEWDNPAKITYPDGTFVSYSYDPFYSNVTQKTDGRGTITKYDYDTKGNLLKLTEAVGLSEQRITEYAYDPYGNKTQEKRLGDANTQEAISTYEYDIRGNATRITDPETNPTAYTYDVMGNALTKLDARGKTWTKTYDVAGRLTSDRNPLLQTTQYQYDKVGRRIKAIDALNNITQYAYDARDNLVAVTDANLKTIQSAYNSEGQRTQVTDQEGKIQRYEYDLDGRLVKTIDGNNNAITSIYGDAQTGLEGLLTKTVYPTYTQELKYDTRNRPVQTIDILNATTSHITAITYDAAGNRTAVTDPEGKTTQYTYDSLNRLVKITDPANGVTENTYDNRDNLITLKDPKGNAHRFEYDKTIRKTKEIRPMGQTTSYAYDAASNLTQITDPKGQVKKYSYDDAGRRIAETHFTATSAITPVKTINYSYNERSALTGYNDSTTSAAYTYDNLQRKTQETVNYGAFSLSYSYTYYTNGLKKSFASPDGVIYSYFYDNNNQLSSTQLPIGAITINSYQWTAPAQITLPGGAVRQQQYDPLMRLTSITAKDAFQNSVMDYKYTYDKAGNVLNKNTEQGNYAYTYDNLYRLAQATYPNLPADAYTYDAVGNRSTDAQAPGSWTYNQNNQLLTAGNITFNYDENGNTVKKTEGAQTTLYIYNTDDRLTEVKDGNNNITATYYYDPFGRRLLKEANNIKTHFFYADEGLIGEYNQIGTQIKAYGYQPQGTWGTDPVFLKIGTNYTFYQNDHLGTPQKLTSTGGTVAWSATYAAFGQTKVDPASTIVNDLRFPGQQFDQETGLHYNWNRYYDQKLGRYVTSDPIGLSGGLNVYAYADENPVNLIDVEGLNTPGKPPQGIGEIVSGIYDFSCRQLLELFLRKMDEQIEAVRRSLAPCELRYCQKSVLFHVTSAIGRCPKNYMLSCSRYPLNCQSVSDGSRGTWACDPPVLLVGAK